MQQVASLRDLVHASRDLSTADASRIDVRPLLAPPRGVPSHSDTSCGRRRVQANAWCGDDADNVDDVSGVDAIDSSELQRFADAPLSGVAASSITHRDETRRAPTQLPVKLDDHPAARSAVAQNMLDRLAADAALYANQLEKSRVACLAALDEATLDAIAKGAAPPQLSLDSLAALLDTLRALQQRDVRAVARGVAGITRRANTVPSAPAADIQGASDRARFQLERVARLSVPVSMSFVTGALLSSQANNDLRGINPFLAQNEEEVLLSAAALVALRNLKIHFLNSIFKSFSYRCK